MSLQARSMDSSSPASIVKTGVVGFFSTYRPPVPLDIYSTLIPWELPHSSDDLPLRPVEVPLADDAYYNSPADLPFRLEVTMTDGAYYNHNGFDIPPAALKHILYILSSTGQSAGEVTDDDVDKGLASGMVFVSERTLHLETLHFSLYNNKVSPPKVLVYNFAKLYGTHDHVRMEDSGRFAKDYLVYVSTKEAPGLRRQPWTAVYKTHLRTGATQRLTPTGTADLSPSVSPSGDQIAVATFEGKSAGWDGEIEELNTDIFVMNVEEPYDRRMLICGGGWPSWGSDHVIFFHRKVDKWAVFRAEISSGGRVKEIRVTPKFVDAVTPAAIGADRVAVAVIRAAAQFGQDRTADQYRHIEIFKSDGTLLHKITQQLADHFNPFVIEDRKDGRLRIGYHRSNPAELAKVGDVYATWQHSKIESPVPGVQLFRAPGPFPNFSIDGKKLAFVDNEFKCVWVADGLGLRKVYEAAEPDRVWSPVWNKNPNKNIVYVCYGPSFKAEAQVDIIAIDVGLCFPHQKGVDLRSLHRKGVHKLTNGHNNGFPSTNPDGTKLVFRSTMGCDVVGDKNLYIMDLVDVREDGQKPGKIRRLTEGSWVDTQCEWSPTGEWIAFSSSRNKPADAPEKDNDLDVGYFAVFLVKPDGSSPPVLLVRSREDVAGHVNHPWFSPDGKSIVFTADLAAVSADPISMPLFLHSVRPYGDLFITKIKFDSRSGAVLEARFEDITRATHSRYENSTCSWTKAFPDIPFSWAQISRAAGGMPHLPACPYFQPDGGESFHMTGHLLVPERLC